MSLSTFLYNQLIQTLPYPTTSYAGKTVIVTGSNVGLGKEAARHIVRLEANTVILAVRNLEKGHVAKEDITRSTGCAESVVQVWQLDMADYSSVRAFAARAETDLQRVDVLLANAGIAGVTFARAEDNESMITVNVVSTFLLTLLLMPKLKQTAARFNTAPTVTIVSSEVHARTDFPEKSAPAGQIFATLNDESKWDRSLRYPTSKLLEIFGVRAIADRHPSSSFPVTVNTVNPGLCHSELARDAGWTLYFMKLVLARSTEYGSRTLVHAASRGPETHGRYLSNCTVTDPSPLVLSAVGKTTQDRVWDELVGKLDAIQPGVTGNL